MRFNVRYRPPITFLIILLVLVVLGACQGNRTTSESDLPTAKANTEGGAAPEADETQELPSQEDGVSVNRIAYVGSDGNIFTIKPDGTDQRRLTSNDFRVGPRGPILAQGLETSYFWPTWAPDGEKLAASRATVTGNTIQLALEVVDTTTGLTTRIYENEPETNFVARGAPHYMYWSPDSSRLAFIASTPLELALFIKQPGDLGPPSPLLGGGPLYFSWLTDSDQLLVHRAGELLLASLSGAPSGPELLSASAVGFNAPAISPDGDRFAFVADGTVQLATLEPAGVPAKTVLNVGFPAAITWSPNGQEVAVADRSDPTASTFERVVVVDGDGISRSLIDEPILAFFWSPNGEKILYAAFDQQERSLTWKYVLTSGGDPVELVTFVPSSEFFTLIGFFDQYGYSNSIWSPDGSQFVFAGVLTEGGISRNGDSPDVAKAYVLEVREGSTPREIADSTFAIWSWN